MIIKIIKKLEGKIMEIERSMCMWCGACVGTCNRNAVTLYETRIEFEENCNDCGICIKVCPVGALYK